MMNRLFSSRVRFGLGVCMASMLAVLVSDNRACAQVKQGKYVGQAAERLVKLIDVANKEGFALHDNSFSVGGGWLKQSKAKWVPLFTIHLKAGTDYRFLAAGDNDARDVDIEIEDADGKSVAKDADKDAEAIVTYRPTKTGDYRVRVRLYASRNDLPCVCLAIVMVK